MCVFMYEIKRRSINFITSDILYIMQGNIANTSVVNRFVRLDVDIVFIVLILFKNICSAINSWNEHIIVEN